MTTPLGLSTYRWNNNIKSLLLVAAFPCLLLLLLATVFYFAGRTHLLPSGQVETQLAAALGVPSFSGSLAPVDFAVQATRLYAPFVLGFAGVWILIGSLFHEGLIRMATRAQPVVRSENPELYNLVENLCISRGITMPTLYMIDTLVMNAYASGLTQRSFAITVTRGIVQALDKDELETVLAHELTHIMNRDVRLLIVSVLFAGMLSFFAEMAWRSMRFAQFSDTGDDRNGRKGASAALMFLIVAVVLFVGYLLSILIRMALSRRREYLADAGAVELTKNPQALIRALQKISGNADMPQLPSGVQAMLIENPPGFFGLLATHPPIESRIAVLRRLDGETEEGRTIIPRAGKA